MELLRNFKACQQYLRIKLSQSDIELKFFHGAQDFRFLHIEVEAVSATGIKHAKFVADFTEEGMEKTFNRAIDALLSSLLMEETDEI
jgi:hypothetical protein